MGRLIAKAFLLLLPLGVISLALAGLAWHSGEALPIKMVAEIQQLDASVIYGSNKVEDVLSYKLQRYDRRLPRILIMGSSRMMQARDQFFTEAPAAVYNAAGPGWDLPMLIQFYERLPQLPEIIIIGIDQFWFNGDLPMTTTREATIESDYGWDSLRQATVETTHKLLGGDLTVAQILAGADPVYLRRSLGLKALENSFGYRADGSLQQGLLNQSPRMQSAHTAAALANFEGEGRFAPASHINQAALDMLKDFVSTLSSDGVKVVGVTPPFHYVIFEAMEASGANQYIDEAARQLARLFDEFGYPYTYFADMRVYGVDSSGWYDRVHLTEAATLRMLLELFEDHPDTFAAYADTSVLRALLANASNPMDVLGELPR